MNFSNGVGNIGAYAETDGTVYNEGNITVGGSDILQNYYSIGMAAKNGGKVVNAAGHTIKCNWNLWDRNVCRRSRIKRQKIMDNRYVIFRRIKRGIWNVSEWQCNRICRSNRSYKIRKIWWRCSEKWFDRNSSFNGATLENHGLIDIDARSSYGIYVRNGVIKNYGTINISGVGSAGVRFKNAKDENGNPLNASAVDTAVNAGNGAISHKEDLNVNNNVGTSAGGTSISPTGVVTINGNVVPVHDLTSEISPLAGNYGFSNVGNLCRYTWKNKPYQLDRRI